MCCNCVFYELVAWNDRSPEDGDFEEWVQTYGTVWSAQTLPRPPITVEIRKAAQLLKEWDASRYGEPFNGGPLHAVIDDANLDDDILNAYLKRDGNAEPNPLWGFPGYQLTDQERELYFAVLNSLKALAVVERYLAWGIYDDCIREEV